MLGLLFVDHDAMPAFLLHARIAIGAAAGSEAALELSLQAAVGLRAQVVEVQLVDQAARDAHARQHRHVVGERPHGLGRQGRAHRIHQFGGGGTVATAREDIDHDIARRRAVGGDVEHLATGR
nr:hypothetical protein [Pseudacidovorax intermedius]